VAAAVGAATPAVQAAAAVLPRPPFQSPLAIPSRSMLEAAAVQEVLMDRRAVAEEAAATVQ
jgi:hypothetical protein